ncbi:MAG: vWA domain-containing protein [Bacillus sp. (in: firmicutes)]
MKPIQFNDSIVDTALFLQLQDLAAVVSGIPDLDFEYNYGALVDLEHKKVMASHHWDNVLKAEKEAGLKTDIFLRAIGTIRHSDPKALKRYKKVIDDSGMPYFAANLFTAIEDLRLEEEIKKDRRGTRRHFDIRRKHYRHYFETQLGTNVTKSYPLDELFCLIYLHLHSDVPDPVFPKANERQLDELQGIKQFLYRVYDARHTADVVAICESVLFWLEEKYDDQLNQYFIFPVSDIEKHVMDSLFDELTRNDELSNCDVEDIGNEDQEVIDETFSTWHRENKNGNQKSTFLQFELEQGTRTSIMGGGARESEEADQAMATVQGSSGRSKQKDYSDLEALEEKEPAKGEASTPIYGERNKDAVKIIKKAKKPSDAERILYNEQKQLIEAEKRRLSNTIQKMMEHKMNAKRRNLLFGRLSKNILPLVIDRTPRVFYKKDQESLEVDAAFTLLVDCSASMNNKMEETKKSIILFHEVLKQLKIPHSIIGFWEDANDAKKGYQPNYFHIISDFPESTLPASGPEIMQLEPEEDNRDGFSIRVAAEALLRRREKSRFLLVFSDGEPAAYNYEKNGIIDTHEAVLETRKSGIEVIGMFLSEGIIQEGDEMMMRNIYGKEFVMVPGVEQLPDYFSALLKRVLLRSLQ